MSTPVATKEQQLISLFSDFSVNFLRGQPLASSDARGPAADLNVGILIELKGLGLLLVFKEFNKFLGMGAYEELMRLFCLVDLKDLKNATTLFATHRAQREFRGLIEPLESIESTRLKEVQKHEGQEGFQEFKELSCFSYFLDFKLLLYSSYSIAINPYYIKGHVLKHCPLLKGREKRAFASKVVVFITSSLEVSSLRESYFLILLFSALFPLYPFKELSIKGELYACSLALYYCTIRSTLYHIKRHLREEHRSLLSNKDTNRCYRAIAQGQALEQNKFFFSVVARDKGKGSGEQGVA